jgi:hypothetical protein
MTSQIRDRLALLVKFDHWAWLLFIIWFGMATFLIFIGSPIGLKLAYWGIVLVLLNNFARLFLLSDHLRITHKKTEWLLSIALILALLLSIIVQYLMRK